MSKLSRKQQCQFLYLLVGTPNVGKSTIFNHLTTSVALVSNIDRMTTEHTTGCLKHEKNFHIVDLPGVYNLSHPIAEEHEVNYHLIKHNITGIVNVIAAKSLERDLYLTLQTLETGMLSTLVINMTDSINVSTFQWKTLSKILGGLNVILTQSNKGINLDKVVKSIHDNNTIDKKIITYSINLENLIEKICNVLPECYVSKRFHAIMLLEGNEHFHNYYKTKHSQIYKAICKIFDLKKCHLYAEQIRNRKLQYIKQILQKCGYNNKKYLQSKKIESGRKADKLFFKGWFGFPLFLLVLIVIYYLAFGNYGGKWLQDQFSAWLSDIVLVQWIKPSFIKWNSPDWCTSLCLDGLINGFFIVLPFLIPIVILYICFSILQQTGFLARTSILFDKLLWHFGISGRSVVTLITGFGCTVPAILLAKSSSSKKERIVATLISPFCVCTTRVIVIAAITGVCFPNFSWLVDFSFIFFSGIIALILGLLFSKILFRREKSFFCVEMVQWTKLDFKVIFKTTWLKIKEFLKRALLIIVACNLVVWVLLNIGPRGYTSDKTQSFLCYISFGLSYINYLFLGICGVNGWQYTTCLLVALPAKELMLGTIKQIFANTNEHPIISLFHIGTPSNALACLRAISFLTFFSFYIPCIPSIVTMHSSVGWKNTGIDMLSSISVAFVLSSLIYWIGFGIIQR